MSTEQQAKCNPGPLGLLGFGMTTVLLTLHNAGIIGLSAVIAAMGFALGGAAQIIAGILEFRNGNTFGGTAFTAYGFFWWSLVAIWSNPFGAGVAVQHNLYCVSLNDSVNSARVLLSWCFRMLLSSSTIPANASALKWASIS